MTTKVSLQVETKGPFAEGIGFGATGPYERLSGQVAFEVDPQDPANRGIVDLEQAPVNASGLVEFSADFYILKPLELERGNRRLLYDVNNRGNKRVLQYLNDAIDSNAPAHLEHAGNGFLMRRGYTLVWSGWQGDILPGNGRLTMRVPVATDNGRELTGVVRAEFIADSPGTFCFPLSGNEYTLSYEVASPDNSEASFTCREYEGDPRLPIAADQWLYARAGDDGRPLPSSTHCYLPAGFKPGWIYELVYTAKNPLVLGVGFLGVRDLVSFLLHTEVDEGGTPNPLRESGSSLEKAYAWGRSQSGRFLREFVYQGFNQDLHGGRVFEAVFPHVAGAGRAVLNYRFAQPGRYSRQHADHLYPSDRFPFAYAVTRDQLTGERDGILKRPDTDPMVIHTQTPSEYWERRGSLVHTDSLGKDLGDQGKVRIYHFASSEHGASPLAGPQKGLHQHLSNPLNTTPLLRALLDAMDAWATGRTPPPESCVPNRGSETLVPAEVANAGFPAIPGVACPGEPSRLYVQDYGPGSGNGVISREPPVADRHKEYAVLVPQVDADGNEVSGVRTPHVEAPLATFTGWNFRPKGSAEKATAGVTGSYLPLANTREQRLATKDPRPSIGERYRSRACYVRAIAVAAQRLVDRRLLLEEDADRYVRQAIEEEAFG